MPNQEPAFALPFGNGSVRVGVQDLSRPCLNTFVKPSLPARLTAPGSPRMNTLIFSECTYIQMLSVMGLGFAILFLSLFSGIPTQSPVHYLQKKAFRT